MKQPIQQPDTETQKKHEEQEGGEHSSTGGKIKKDIPEGTDEATGGLTKEDLPDSTNESTGVPGTGQRQDSN